MHDLEHVRAWKRLDDDVTTSGQPSVAEFSQIKALGVDTVVNLAPEDAPGALPGEAEAIAELGMNYVHIPVEFSNPTEADFTAFCDAMTQLAGQTVHVHCIINARVSAFFYRYRRDRLGWPEDKARAAMLEIWDPATYGEHGKAWPPFLKMR